MPLPLLPSPVSEFKRTYTFKVKGWNGIDGKEKWGKEQSSLSLIVNMPLGREGGKKNEKEGNE